MIWFTVVALLVPLALAIVIGLTVFGLTRKARVQQPGWQPTTPMPGSSYAGTGEHGVWNAQLLGGGLIGALGGTLNATFGTFRLDAGVLAFVPDGADAPAWTVPCPALAIRFHGTLAPAAITLVGPMGEIRCDVSVEHLNRVTRNSLKSLREGRHARAFADALVANGARWS